MSHPMVFEMQFYSVAELQALQEFACKVEEDVAIVSPDDTINVDAKSFIGLFTLDFSQPVKVVTESAFVMQKMEKLVKKRQA